jgi:hypothetical protein
VFRPSDRVVTKPYEFAELVETVGVVVPASRAG